MHFYSSNKHCKLACCHLWCHSESKPKRNKYPGKYLFVESTKHSTPVWLSCLRCLVLGQQEGRTLRLLHRRTPEDVDERRGIRATRCTRRQQSGSNKIVYLQRVAIFQDLNMGLHLLLRCYLVLKIYDGCLCSRQAITDLLIGAKTFNDSVLDSNGFKRISVKIKKKNFRLFSLSPPLPPPPFFIYIF